MLIEFDAAYKALLPYFDKVWGVVNGSWQDWNEEVSPKVRALASSGSRAHLVNDFMRTRARRLAEEDENINAVISKQMFVLVFSPPEFQGCIGIRFKKLDDGGLSRNQPSAQVQSYRDQLVLPGVMADYHLEAGYVLDKFESALKSVDMVCPSGEGIFWKAEIVPNNAVQNVASLFGAEQQVMKEVKVRRKVDENAGEKDGNGTS